MSNSIDWGTLTLGALIGVGCRKQIKSAGRIAANTVSVLAGAASAAADQIAQSPEEKAADTWLNHMDQQIQSNGNSNGGNGNGN